MPSGTIQKDITKKYGSFSEFKSTFTDMATNYFGSGINISYLLLLIRFFFNNTLGNNIWKNDSNLKIGRQFILY